MIIKKLVFILTLLAVTNCGYEPIYSKKETLNISINKIELIGDKKINRSIVSFANLRETKNVNYSYNLNLNSSKKIEVVSKDSAGNVTSFKITIIVKFSLKDPNDKDAAGNITTFKITIIVKFSLKDPNDNGTVIKSKNFRTSFIYNNKKNKFDLLQYEKIVEKNLVEKIAEEITIYINS